MTNDDKTINIHPDASIDRGRPGDKNYGSMTELEIMEQITNDIRRQSYLKI